MSQPTSILSRAIGRHGPVVVVVLALLCACRPTPGSLPAAAGADASPAAGPAGASGPPAASGAAAGSRIPERFQGLWARDARACESPAHESKLTLDAGRIGFHESEGPVRAVRVDGDLLTVVSTLSGEGVSRDASHDFRLGAEGTTLTALQGGLVRVRCPP